MNQNEKNSHVSKQNTANLLKKRTTKTMTLLVSLLCLLTAGIAGTLAYLYDSAIPVINELVPGKVPPVVVEDIDGDVKESVSIRNDGNVDAYIRASIVITWKDADGNTYGKAPVSGTDYSMTIPSDDAWVLGADGYYYYKSVVAAGGSTTSLLTDGTFSDTANPPTYVTGTDETTGEPVEANYNLSMEILAQTIQAGGEDEANNEPVLLTWGTTDGGSVVSVNEDGTLVIKTADSTD